MTFTVTFKHKVLDSGEMVSIPSYFVDGKPVSEKKFDALIKKSGLGKPGCPMAANARYPKLSKSAAVHKSQVKEAIEEARKRGVPTDYAATGEPVFTSRAHQKRFTKAHGMHNYDGGYGD